MNAKPTYGLIGRGRVASHMARYLSLEGQPCIQWHRGSAPRLEGVLEPCDVILLAISDDAIGPFVANHPLLANRSLVHFSGSLVVDGINGCHPLMTFGPEFYDLPTYRSMAFVTERGGVDFETLFPALVNPAWVIDPALKPVYHALCVLGGNFTTLLWAKVFADFEDRLGLPASALRPYLEQTCSNLVSSGGAALTGPLSRGDRKTIENNLEALKGDPFAEVYRAFVAVSELEEVTG